MKTNDDKEDDAARAHIGDVQAHALKLFKILHESIGTETFGASDKLHASALVIACRVLEGRATGFMRETGAPAEAIQAMQAMGDRFSTRYEALVELVGSQVPLPTQPGGDA